MTLCEMALEENDDSMLAELDGGLCQAGGRHGGGPSGDAAAPANMTANNAHARPSMPARAAPRRRTGREMLYRMYTRWAERHGFTVQDPRLSGRRRGGHQIRHHSDRGRQRLRLSARARTACTAWCAFRPSTPTPAPPDLLCRGGGHAGDWTTTSTWRSGPRTSKCRCYRSSGAGGQHINKTSSAVRLIHMPTGIVVSCQNERSQFQNRDTCMKMLRAKLIEIKEREHLEKISDIKGVQMKIEWGSQIRSYVFMPYHAGQGSPARALKPATSTP